MVRVFNEILGKDVVMADRPIRIISMSPAITETLFMLGLEDRVVGVSAFCARPEAARVRKKRKVGSYSTASADLLAQMKPDLILTITGYQRDLALRLSTDFPVYPLSLPVSVSGIIDMIVKVGLVVNEAERGWALASGLVRMISNSKPIGKRLRTYVEIDLGGPVTFGAYSYITDALHLLGASTLFDGARSEWLTPNLEGVLREDPDVIFYEGKMYSKFDQQDLERLIDERGWRQMDAVRNGRCFLTPGPLDFLAHHGPAFITEVIPWLAERLGSDGAE
jgi:iron complex transport system substrate-binding protein